MLECYPRHRRGYRISHLRIYALFFAGLGGGAFFCFCQEHNWKVLLRWKHIAWDILLESFFRFICLDWCCLKAADMQQRTRRRGRKSPRTFFFDVLSKPGSTLEIDECISNPKKDFVNGRSWAKRKYIWNSKHGFYFKHPKPVRNGVMQGMHTLPPHSRCLLIFVCLGENSLWPFCDGQVTFSVVKWPPTMGEKSRLESPGTWVTRLGSDFKYFLFREIIQFDKHLS